jgi:acyl-CoA synthetase (NDP forming)
MSEVRHELDPFFRPSSVAVVGVSGKQDSLSARLLRYLYRHGYRGDVYPVNPRYPEMGGVRCYPSLAAVPAPVDLALILLPARDVIGAIRDAGSVGTKAAIVFGSGFAETGAEGHAAEAQMLAEAERAGIRILGPNSQGLYHAPTALAATFNPALQVDLPDDVGIAYVGQSGALGASFIDLARESGVGVSTMVSTGNESETTLTEVGQYLIEDDSVRTLALYIEAIPRYDEYLRLLREAKARGKRVLVLRSGRSTAGRRAVASHTGSMLDEHRAIDIVTADEGGILVRDMDELVYAAAMLREAPTSRVNGVGIVTTSGGAGGLVADACEGAGFSLPTLPEPTMERLRDLVPYFGAVSNPVDVTAQVITQGGAAFREVCASIVEADNIDALIVVLGMATGEAACRIAADVVVVTEGQDKPILVTWLAGLDQTTDGRALLRKAGIPVLASVTAVPRMLEMLSKAVLPPMGEAPVALDPGITLGPILRECLANSGQNVTEAEGRAFLDQLGIPRPESYVVNTQTEAAEAARTLGGDVVAKVQSSNIAHKTEVGGVRRVNQSDVPRTFEELDEIQRASTPADDFGAVLLQRPAPEGGVEILVAVTASTAGFPHLISVGIGGVGAEIYRDIVTRTVPVTSEDARDMLKGLIGAPLLFGFRGRPALDVDAAARVIASVSNAAEAVGDLIYELELNPVRVYPRDLNLGAIALDFMMHKVGDGR